MEKISPIKERILQFLEIRQISKVDFCKATGISYANLKGKGLASEIGGLQIAKILSIYKEMSSEWLIMGQGPMLKPTNDLAPLIAQEEMEKISGNNNIPVAKHCGNGEGIPLITVEAMAGFAKENPPVLEYECERYVVPMFRDAEFLITVKGSSMIPKYNSGDIVACKMLPLSDLFFQWNKVYVLDTVQGALIKRVKAGHDKEHILIVSDNDRYEPFELHMSQIRSVALVIGVIRLE